MRPIVSSSLGWSTLLALAFALACQATPPATVASDSAAISSVVDDAKPCQPKRVAFPEPGRDGLADMWVLERAPHRTDGSAEPKRHDRLFLDAGEISWFDGCNSHSGTYLISGEQIVVREHFHTDVWCGPPVDGYVPFEAITRYRLNCDTLTLFTPTETYVLHRSPHSRMSQHPWGLHSIKDLRSGETFDVGRFRKEYGRLLLVVERDRSFHFVDLDGEEFSGTLEVEGSRILRMAYDEESQRRASNFVAPDLHSAPADGPPTTFAAAIDWPSVGSFRVERGMSDSGGPERPSNLLILVSDSHEYAFFGLSEWHSGLGSEEEDREGPHQSNAETDLRVVPNESTSTNRRAAPSADQQASRP